MRTLNAFDMFSGVGGFRIGAELFGKKHSVKFKWIGRAEIEPHADRTYKTYFAEDGTTNWGDIQNLTGPLDGDESKETKKTEELLPTPVDILFAGFPCQPFSTMGARLGLKDARGTLFFAIATFLEAKKPRYFVLENVRGLMSDANGNTLKMIRKILKELGYQTAVWMLNSADYGVPHVRRRVYIVGDRGNRSEKLDDADTPPVVANIERKYPTSWHLLEKDVAKKYPGKSYYLSEKIKPTILSKGSGGYSYEWSIDNIDAKPLCRTMHKMHRASQDNYFSDAYINGRFDKKTMKVKQAGNGKDRIRRLTPLEAFRLQGLPDEMVINAKKTGMSDTQLYMQAGNSVSATTVSAVVKKLVLSA
ncbi:MAG: DNA (cytosine-5-)-methyltransferase [Opitutales bacterium]|nr:DNA (cytosine-5-)-methyltransferase [Opitutales bacterium]